MFRAWISADLYFRVPYCSGVYFIKVFGFAHGSSTYVLVVHVGLYFQKWYGVDSVWAAVVGLFLGYYL